MDLRQRPQGMSRHELAVCTNVLNYYVHHQRRIPATDSRGEPFNIQYPINTPDELCAALAELGREAHPQLQPFQMDSTLPLTILARQRLYRLTETVIELDLN